MRERERGEEGGRKTKDESKGKFKKSESGNRTNGKRKERKNYLRMYQ